MRLIVRTAPVFQREKEYIINVVFEHFLGIEVQILWDAQEPDYAISIEGEDTAPLVLRNDLLSAKNEHNWLKPEMLPQLPLCTLYVESSALYEADRKSIKVLYGNAGEGLSGVDFLGSIFFCISLFEECVGKEVDRFERYLYTQSVLYQEDLLARPIVNEYLELLYAFLKRHLPGLQRKERSYSVVLSHDIDSPFANNYGWWNFLRSCGADIIIRRSPSLFFKRVSAKLSGNFRQDPHFTLEYLMNVSEQNGLQSTFNFIPIHGGGGINGCYDIDSDWFREIVLQIEERGHYVGVHPSFDTYLNAEKVKAEFEKLRSVCAKAGLRQKVWGGRQHYLRFKNPDTWRNWATMGADYDSTVGSESYLGFRAGTCYEYPVFDLIERRRLELIEYPLIVMDVAAFKMGSFENYSEQIVSLAKKVRFYKGNFTLLYHNNYIICSSQKAQYELLVARVKQA